MTRKHIIISALVIAGIVGGYYVWQSKSTTLAKKPRATVQSVKTVLAQKQALPVTIRANGSVVAVNTVEVRPQVQNIVRTVHVKEGQDVTAGQLLFTLDARSDQAGVAGAQAQLARNRADLAEAEATLKRNQDLQAREFVSQAAVETARNQVAALRSTLQGDTAAIQSSQVALGKNTITASISGRIGAISVRPGSLAQPAGAPMLTIAQLDPIAVSFPVAERELRNILATYPKGDAPVIAQLIGGEEVKGKLIFIDNAVDAQTGTIGMKAQFENGQRHLWPGTFVSVRLVARTLDDAVVVPVQAVVTGPERQFVYVVQADSTVQPRKVTVLNIEQGQAALSGLEAGSRVVIEGTQNLRQGGKVAESTSKKTEPAQGAKASNGSKDKS